MNSSDFLFLEYQRMIKQAISSRSPLTYGELEKVNARSLFWRHDIDVSLRQANVLSDIDNLAGMVSTFFVNLHADTYNALSAFGVAEINKILSKGHQIGIHLDSEFYGHFASEEELEKALSIEVMIFEDSFSVTPTVFSFHNPSSKELTFTKLSYGGLVNCYAQYFQNEVDYVSDSNGFWRHQSLDSMLSIPAMRPLQVLTHAEWWSKTPLAPRERLVQNLFQDSLQQVRRYDESMAKRGRENKSDLRDNLADPKQSVQDLLELLRDLDVFFDL